MLLRVFTLTLSPSVRTVSSAALPFPSVWARRYWVITSRILFQPPRYLRVHPEYLLTSMHTRLTHTARLTRSRTHTHARVHGASVLRHVYRPCNNARSNTDALSHAKCSRGNTESKLRTGGTRFTDPSCERRYRYLHRPISSRRLIGSAREYLGPTIGLREKAFGACTLCDHWADSPAAYTIRNLPKTTKGKRQFTSVLLSTVLTNLFPRVTSDSVDRYVVWYAAIHCSLEGRKLAEMRFCKRQTRLVRMNYNPRACTSIVLMH